MEHPTHEDLRRKWNAVVSAAVAEVEAELLRDHPGFHKTMFFGALGIDPKHLAIWCFFKMAVDLREAREKGLTERIQEATRCALRRHGYPDSLASAFRVSFATDEAVQRTCGGSYWYFLK